MPDLRFFHSAPPLGGLDIRALIEKSGQTTPDLDVLSGTIEIADLAAPEEATARSAIFISDPASAEALAGRSFGLCLTSEKVFAKAGDAVSGGPCIRLADPRLVFILAAERLYQEKRLNGLAGPILPGAPDAAPVIGEGTVIDKTAVIGPGVSIGRGSWIGPHVSIGPGCTIGQDCEIEAGVSISHADLGAGCRLLPGVRIGQAGFGVHHADGKIVRVPQLGAVRIGNSVEIGANSCVDRGALRNTIIGDGTKIDNLVQIAHNVRIGRNCVIAGRTGISGSCVIGDGVSMGGSVGLADHIHIGNGARLAANAGVMHDVPAGQSWGGIPAKPLREFMREVAIVSKLAKNKGKTSP